MHSVAICAQVVIVLSIAFVWIVRYSSLDLSSLGAIPHGPGHSRSRAVSVGALYTRFVVASWMYALLCAMAQYSPVTVSSLLADVNSKTVERLMLHRQDTQTSSANFQG
jgi:hypothetical protein